MGQLIYDEETGKENGPMSTVDVIPASNVENLFILCHGLFWIYEIAQTELFYRKIN